ncbi:MAG TPA: DUF4097 family beta strand repeat-containing protein [Acidimicrobiia bacterium]|nr:DUF4097 family beta strand repeat-containing protein [Acidimicrobiia bacterium]
MSHYSFPAGNAPALEFRVASGRLDLVESPDGTITVDVTGRGADNIIVEQIGDTVSIREDRTRFTDRSVSVRVAVPPRTAADITAASLDVYARVELGRVNARTASGQLDLSAIAAGELRSASGDINLDSCQGRCQISTASGDVRGRSIAGDLVVSTASGDVYVDTVKGRVEAKSASGDIDVACCQGPSVEVVSMSGDVSVGLPEGRRVEAQIDSLSGDVTLPPRKAPTGGEKETVRLRAKTVSGDVRVERVEG